MPTYAYRCAAHGPLDVVLPMGTAPPRHDCPHGDGPAVRVFTAPALRAGSTAARALLDRTSGPPTVVPAPPTTPARRSSDPAHARLPRP